MAGVTRTKSDAVMSSRMWSERLELALPTDMDWPLYELITEKEFRKRVKSKSK